MSKKAGRIWLVYFMCTSKHFITYSIFGRVRLTISMLTAEPKIIFVIMKMVYYSSIALYVGCYLYFGKTTETTAKPIMAFIKNPFLAASTQLRTQLCDSFKMTRKWVKRRNGLKASKLLISSIIFIWKYEIYVFFGLTNEFKCK